MVCRQLNMEESVAEIMNQLGADENGKICFQDFTRCRMQLIREIRKEEIGLSEKSDNSWKKKRLRDRTASWPTSSDHGLGRYAQWQSDSVPLALCWGLREAGLPSLLMACPQAISLATFALGENLLILQFWNRLSQLGTWTHVLELKPSQNPVWDSNPRGWDLNPDKTHGTWFQDLMKLRFLMSHLRKNSERDKEISKKWIYSDSERSPLHRQSVGHRRAWVWGPRNVAWLVSIGWVIAYANEREDYSVCFGEGVEISRNWAAARCLVFWQCLRPVEAPPVRHFTRWLSIRV